MSRNLAFRSMELSELRVVERFTFGLTIGFYVISFCLCEYTLFGSAESCFQTRVKCQCFDYFLYLYVTLHSRVDYYAAAWDVSKARVQ
jgi:hypothetical protein